MNRMHSMALPALLALGGLGLWSSSAAAQYVGGGTAYAPVYYYAPGPSYYGPVYYFVPRAAAGPYYYTPPASYYAAPTTSFRYSVVVPGGSSGWNNPALAAYRRPVPSPNSGLEPESLPAQLAEDIAPAPAVPSLRRPWRPNWWWGRTWWSTSRNW
jgi:hypothetical protein